MQRSYIDYAMSVIIGRALPDVRDGLKPVHTRILYAMYDGGFRPDRGFFKCSRVVGDVMGNYHPHGDSSIYDALVRMAQPWSMRMPLIDSQGNFGSPGNDPPAAMRYTECRLTPLAMEMLRDINEETVDFRGNYDGLLVDVPQHFHRQRGQAALGVPHGRGRVVAGRAEVALAVDERHPHRPGLRHPDQRVVDRAVAVRVVVAHDVADDPRALEEAAVRTEPAVVHRVQDPRVHRLEPVPHVGQGTADDDRHRVVDVAALHLVLDVDRLGTVVPALR